MLFACSEKTKLDKQNNTLKLDKVERLFATGNEILNMRIHFGGDKPRVKDPVKLGSNVPDDCALT